MLILNEKLYETCHEKRVLCNCNVQLGSEKGNDLLLRDDDLIIPPIPLPLPDLPTNRRSLNLATWFFMMAVQLRSSPHQFSSFPALTVTRVPSSMSSKATT